MKWRGTKAEDNSGVAWNLFEITARRTDIEVRLNGIELSRLEGGMRELAGHIALQSHHEGSAVQFRRVEVTPLR